MTDTAPPKLSEDDVRKITQSLRAEYGLGSTSKRIIAAVEASASELERLATELARAEQQRNQLADRLRQLLHAHPVFRSRPVGGEGSQARRAQQDAIEAEDAARLTLAALASTLEDRQ